MNVNRIVAMCARFNEKWIKPFHMRADIPMFNSHNGNAYKEYFQSIRADLIITIAVLE